VTAAIPRHQRNESEFESHVAGKEYPNSGRRFKSWMVFLQRVARSACALAGDQRVSRNLLKQYDRPWRRTREYLQVVRTAGLQMGHLVEELLAFSELGRSRLKKAAGWPDRDNGRAGPARRAASRPKGAPSAYQSGIFRPFGGDAATGLKKVS